VTFAAGPWGCPCVRAYLHTCVFWRCAWRVELVILARDGLVADQNSIFYFVFICRNGSCFKASKSVNSGQRPIRLASGSLILYAMCMSGVCVCVDVGVCVDVSVSSSRMSLNNAGLVDA